ncbi:hypothetical protein GCM10022285_25060 [Streptomyces tunisiensis]|uniref:DJ-1/PfpI domain-containing protein n=1 Tax=Streptomyces tunisiensis TaxID=948699 RepID=A0ABP7YB66_9ACTN
MQIAVVLFDRFTALDAVGPYELLVRLPGAGTVLVAERSGPVRDDAGSLALAADRSPADVPHPDDVVVPGGPGKSAQMDNEALLDRLPAADASSTWTASVCTGSLLLAAAGLLRGRRAASHWLTLGHLERYGAEATGERVVTDGTYVTAAGVSSGTDNGAHPARPSRRRRARAGRPAAHRVRPAAALRPAPALRHGLAAQQGPRAPRR